MDYKKCGYMIDTDNGFHLGFVKGNFDDYCVQVSKNGYNYRWFRDDEYFRWIKKLSEKYGVEQVYEDFVYVYDNVWVGVDSKYANKIVRIVDNNYREPTQHWWGLFYMTMLAEEYKENAILGKRIKHLGVYNVLIDEYKISYVVKYMRGKPWEYLDDECYKRGI